MSVRYLLVCLVGGVVRLSNARSAPSARQGSFLSLVFLVHFHTKIQQLWLIDVIQYIV